MSQAIDEARVRHIAKLARLALTDDEVRLFSGQLAEIVNYFKQLDEVDTDGVEPMAHALSVMDIQRDDCPRAWLDTAAALRNAPQQHESFFQVPPVLGGGGA